MSLSTIKENSAPLLPNEYNDFARPLLHSLSAISGVALGILTGIAVTAGLSSPVGLIITGSIIVIGLTASLAYGGKRQLLINLACAVSGFCAGFFMGGVGGALQIQQSALAAGRAAGLTGKALTAWVTAATRSTLWVIPTAFGSAALSLAAGAAAFSLAKRK